MLLSQVRQYILVVRTGMSQEARPWSEKIVVHTLATIGSRR